MGTKQELEREQRISELAEMMEVHNRLQHVETKAILTVSAAEEDFVELSLANRRFQFTWDEMRTALDDGLLYWVEVLESDDFRFALQRAQMATLELMKKMDHTEGNALVPLVDYSDLNCAEPGIESPRNGNDVRKLLETPKEQQGYLYLGYELNLWAGTVPDVKLYDWSVGEETTVPLNLFGAQFRLANPDEQPPEEQDAKEETNEED